MPLIGGNFAGARKLVRFEIPRDPWTYGGISMFDDAGANNRSMDVRTAESLLEGQPLVAAIGGSIADMKKLRERCLDAEIAATVGCPPGSGKG